MTVADSAPSRPDHRAVLASFTGQVRPVAIAWPYRIALAAVALLMVLLPLLYLAIVAAAAYGVFAWATEGWSLVAAIRPRKLGVAIYATPLIAGGILVLFMIKPLFAPRQKRQDPRTLDPEDEPFLHAFVRRVAEAVGAPPPRRIDVDCQVNASAGFRRGMLSFFGRDLVLTVGMPLVAGLSLQQLAGVLAHELGHFSQGGGMRLSYLIRSINYWFHRVVHERDGWDASLEETRRSNDSWLVMAIAHLSSFFVWISRSILRGLMNLGHLVSSYLLRQMELDADRYEARLVGSRTFESTCRELGRLGVAYQRSLSDLAGHWSEGKLGRSVPELVAVNRRRLPKTVMASIERAVDESTTERFATHPADRERIASAYREGERAIFESDLPARVLFRDFDALSEVVSLDFYRASLGDEVTEDRLREVEDLVAAQDAAEVDFKACRRFLGVLASPLSLPPLPEEDALPGRGGRLVALDDLHRELAAHRETLVAWARHVERKGALPVEGEEAALYERLQALVGERMALALGLAEERGGAGAEAGDIERLITAYRGLAGRADDLRQIRLGLDSIFAILEQLRNSPGDETLNRRISEDLDAIHGAVSRFREGVEGLVYPFDHSDGEVALAEVLVRGRPDVLDPNELLALAQDVFQRGIDVTWRVLTRLAAIAEEAERRAGLEPAPLDDESGEKEAAGAAG